METTKTHVETSGVKREMSYDELDSQYQRISSTISSREGKSPTSKGAATDPKKNSMNMILEVNSQKKRLVIDNRGYRKKLVE